MKSRLIPRDTHDRIVAAAGEIFGERGFRGTTVRQITERARVNVAAVNYHFRDKDELYAQVLRDAKGWTGSLDNDNDDVPGSPETRLRAFIVSFVGALLHPNRPAWHARVISQEMLNPTPALGNLMAELTAPLFLEMRRRVAAAAGESLPSLQVDLLACSVLGQCLFYVRSCPAVLTQVAPELNAPGRVDAIAHHIANFSLAALRGLYPTPTS